MKRFIAWIVVVALTAVSPAALAEEQSVSIANLPAVIVKTVPQAGDLRVDPNTTEIRVTYSKRMMDKSWSWGQISNDTAVESTGKVRYLADGKTCVMPVKLKPNHTYVIQLNALDGSFGNFVDRKGRSAVPYLLAFKTGRAAAK